MPSPSHTLLLCLSLTDVYVLISNCSSTCALQTFQYIYTMINIHKTQSHIHSHQLMYLQCHAHTIHTLVLPAPSHILQLITQSHAVRSHCIVWQTLLCFLQTQTLLWYLLLLTWFLFIVVFIFGDWIIDVISTGHAHLTSDDPCLCSPPPHLCCFSFRIIWLNCKTFPSACQSLDQSRLYTYVI